MRNDFAIFILTHGRASNVYTEKTLKTLGYTGRLYYIIDNEDDQADEYYERYGDSVIMFDKPKSAEYVDAADNFQKRTCILYARNECWNIASMLGLKWFMQLDDDVSDIQWRWEEKGKLKGKKAVPFDDICEAFIEWMEDSDADTVAFCQGGDFIGGVNGSYGKGILRKAMNSFFCRTDRPIEFKGTMNEDVSMYTNYGNRGRLIMSSTKLCLVPMATQSVAGGMTEEYKETGTYIKSFYSVMISPHKVSLDAWDEDSYKAARGVHAYQKTVENIKRYADFKKRTGGSTRLGIQMCVTNPDDILRFYEANKSLPVDYIVFRPIESTRCSYYRDKKNGRVVPNIIEQLRIISDEDNRVKINYKWYELDKSFDECLAHWSQVAMNELGELIYCCHKPYEKICHVLETDAKERYYQSVTDISMCDVPCRLTGPNKQLEEILSIEESEFL